METFKKAELKNLICAAMGKQEVDLLLKDGNLVNVFTGEIYKENIAITDGFIVGFGDYEAKQEISLKNKFIVPGLIDGHLHIESTMLSVREFARTVTPLGTTSCIIDPHEIANVLGIDGIKYILESAKFQPINIFVMLPSCVPSTNLETSGANLSAFDLYPFVTEKWVVGLAEFMNFQAVISCDKDVLNKLKIFSNKRIDGHCPQLSGKNLSAYITAGIRSDHETVNIEEAREKLRKGMFLMIREGTCAKNLETLLPVINDRNKNRIIFVTDDRHPADLMNQGHINYMIKKAIDYGISPVDAIRFATINTAEYFRLDFVGAIGPGYMADILVLEDLKKFNIELVFKKGKIVAKNNKYIGKDVKTKKISLRSSINVKWLNLSDFKLKQKTKKARIIQIVSNQLITKEKIIMLPGAKYFKSDIKNDYLKIFVVERHLASGNIGKGIVNGFGIKYGAIASSVAHDAHNIICVGVDDESIMTAVVEIVKMGGGYSITKGMKILGKLSLPIAGLMSETSVFELGSNLEKLINIYKNELKGSLDDPFMALSFLALPVIPEIKLTDLGLISTKDFKIMDLFIK